jgi:diguanylate cyclase (GGDEF)-like protein
VDLQRFVDTQVAPLLRDATRLLLLHADGTPLAVTGDSLSDGRSWFQENEVDVRATAGIVDRSAGHHTMRKSHGELDFLLVSPVSTFRRDLTAAWQWAGLTALVLIVVPGVIALLLSRSMSSRLRTLAAVSRRLDGRRAVEIDATGNDEIAELALALRDLNARVVGSTEVLETMVSQRTAVIEEQKAELVRLNERLREMASRDSLTQLLNRRAFEEQAANVFALARREGRGLGVAMIDIDFFKMVNDEYGHQAGDEALRVVASLLQEHFRRDSDLIGRYGGEEFAVVTTAARVDGEFAHVLEEFRTTVSGKAIEAEGRNISLTVSCGAVVTIPQPEDELEQLLNSADRALYRAKEQGRNRLVLSRESTSTIRGR